MIINNERRKKFSRKIDRNFLITTIARSIRSSVEKKEESVSLLHVNTDER